MSVRRWHQDPQLSPLVLLIPLAFVLFGVWYAIQATSSIKQFTNAITGANDLRTPMLIRFGAVTLAGIALLVIIAVLYRHITTSDKAIRGRFMRSPGWAKRRRQNPSSVKGIRNQLHDLLPTTLNPTVEDASVVLGTDARGKPFLLSCQESMLVIGPPSSGKDRRVAAPLAISWPGPAFITSTKVDLAQATLIARAERGPIIIFNPEGYSLKSRTGPNSLRWNPVNGCEDRDVAARRAAAIIAGGAPSMTEQFWHKNGALILGYTLHAAALAGKNVIEAGSWAMSVPGWLAASEILRSHGETEWAGKLREFADLDPRTTSSLTATLSSALAGLSNANLRKDLTPDPTDLPVDIKEILKANGTIYAIAPGESDSHLIYRPWTTLLASDIVAVLKEMAQGARLEPPALLLLNELVHVCPLPELPNLLADGRGHNIAIWAIVQDPSQLADRYEPDKARAITAAAQHRLLLGAGNNDTAQEWSDLIGTYRSKQRSRTHKPMGVTAQSANVSLEDRPIMPPGELRHLPYGCAVMLPRGQSALPLQLCGD